jgi:dsRNA-specific ribonuclease
MNVDKNKVLIREFSRSKSQVYFKLERLKKLDILKYSLTSTDVKENKEIFLNENLNIFETLEFYGDAVLYERITKNLVMTKKFCTPHMLSTMRSSTVCNKTLSSVYDSLELFKLSNTSFSPSYLDVKQKGDIIEAIIGEISLYLNSNNSLGHLVKLCEDALDDFISYINYAGDAAYFYTISNNLNETKKEVSSVGTSVKEKEVNPSNDGNLCYKCSQKGHVQRNCPMNNPQPSNAPISKFSPIRDRSIEPTMEIKIEEEEISLDEDNSEKETNKELEIEKIIKNEKTIDKDSQKKIEELKSKKKKKKEKTAKLNSSTDEGDNIIDFEDFTSDDVIYLPDFIKETSSKNQLNLDDFF